MVPWGWLVFAFICGVAATVFCMKGILIYVMTHNLDWASSWLKRTYETIEKARLEQSRKT